MKKFVAIILFFTFHISYFTFSSFAQIGGSSTYEFLNLVPSARVAALGGNLISVKDHDINLVFQNPSLLDSSMNNDLAMNIVNDFAGINYGYAAYIRDFKKWGTYNAGINFIRYGNFQEAYSNGDLTGNNFLAGEYAFNIGWGKPLNNLSNWFDTDKRFDTLFFGGANLKMIYSSLEDYYAIGVAADLAVTYYNSKI